MLKSVLGIATPWCPLFYALCSREIVLDPCYALPDGRLGSFAGVRTLGRMLSYVVLAEGGTEFIMNGLDTVFWGFVHVSSNGIPVVGDTEPISLNFPPGFVLHELVSLVLCRPASNTLCSVIAGTSLQPGTQCFLNKCVVYFVIDWRLIFLKTSPDLAQIEGGRPVYGYIRVRVPLRRPVALHCRLNLAC